MKQQIGEQIDVPCIDPCPHMEHLVHSLADGSLVGPQRWYIQLHLLWCQRCRTALNALYALRSRLQNLRKASDTTTTNLSGERHSALDDALNALDRQHR